MDATAATPPAGPEIPLFQATVKPHRSLSRKGTITVICLMLLGSLTVTSLMVSLSAWPVIGFNGGDIMLACILIWRHIRAARSVEIISLRHDRLEISRTDSRGRQEHFSLAPYWLNIVLENATERCRNCCLPAAAPAPKSPASSGSPKNAISRLPSPVP